MVIGSYGELIFEVSALKILTFDGYKRQVKAKYAEHEILNRPAVLEFLYRELEEVSLVIKAVSQLGVTPEKVALILRDMCQRGEPNYLIIGEMVISENEMVITEVNENVQQWHGANIGVNTLNVNFKEYIQQGD